MCVLSPIYSPGLVEMPSENGVESRETRESLTRQKAQEQFLSLSLSLIIPDPYFILLFLSLWQSLFSMETSEFQQFFSILNKLL